MHKVKYKPAMLREQPTITLTCFGRTLYCTNPRFVMLCSTNILIFFLPFHQIYTAYFSCLHHLCITKFWYLLLVVTHKRSCTQAEGSTECLGTTFQPPRLTSPQCGQTPEFVGVCLLGLYFTIWPNTGKCSNGNTSCNISSVVTEFPLKCSLVE